MKTNVENFFEEQKMNAIERKFFDRGFLCAVVTAYDDGTLADKDLALFFLQREGGFESLDDCLACDPDVYDVEKLKEIYGVDDAEEE